MPTDPPSLDQALAEIHLQKDAVRIAEAGVRQLRAQHQIDSDQADVFLARLDSRLTTLNNKENSIIDTGSVTIAPSSDQISALRARVDALRNRNVTAASIEGIISSAFALAAAIEPAGAPTQAATTGRTTATPAGFSGVWIGVAAIFVLAALARTIRNARSR